MATPVDDPTLKPDAAQGLTKKPVGIPVPGQPTDIGGTAPANPMQVTPPPLSTNDPMAFAPRQGAAFGGVGDAPPMGPAAGGTIAPPAPSPFTGTTYAHGGAVSLNPDEQAQQADPNHAATGALSAFTHYTPMAGLDENQKQAYGAAQGGTPSQAYTLDPKTGLPVLDQAKLAALQTAGQPLVGQANAGTAGALSALNGARDAENAADNYGFQQAFFSGGKEVPLVNGQVPNGQPAAANGGVPLPQPSSGPLSPLSPSSALTSPAPSGGLAGASLGPQSGQSSDRGFLPAAIAAAASGGGYMPPANGGVGLSAIDPNNSLLNQTIAPNSSVDRVKLAQNSLQSTIDNILNPQEEADQKATLAHSFGAGRGVSGMNRTALGNVESDYGHRRAQMATDVLNPAIAGSIGDMYNNLGIAQQQQGFQAGQQQNAFGQGVAQKQLEDQLTNSAFGRSATQEQLGSANDPSQIALILSQLFGNQSSQAGNAAAGLFRQQGRNSANPNGVGGGGSSTNQNAGADDGQ